MLVKSVFDYILGMFKQNKYTPPSTYQDLITFVGKFEFKESTNGTVTILGNWQKDNIVTITLAITDPTTNKFWKVQVHKKIQTIVQSLFKDYVDKGFEKVYKIYQIGGFVPRHKMNNPKRSLSIHAFGLALDLNWDHNKVGTNGSIPTDVVNLFKQYGFNWGGLWKNLKDPMHFQYYAGEEV